MEITIAKIAESLIKDIVTAFLEHSSETTLEKQFENLNLDKKNEVMEDRIEFRINCIKLKSKALAQLTEERIFLTNEELLAEWLVAYLHQLLCITPKDSPPSFKIIYKLPKYAPANNILEVSKYVKPLDRLPIYFEFMREYITDQKLNVDNVHKIFQVLLQLEDIASLQEYVPLIQRGVTLKKYSTCRYSAKFKIGTPANIKDILTPNLDVVTVLSTEKSKSLDLKSDIASIKKLIEEYESFEKSTAIIKDLSASSVQFQFNEPISLKEDEVQYDLIFYSMRYPIRYQHCALEMLAVNSQLREYLFPKLNLQKESKCLLTDIELVNTEIKNNPEQLQAVHYISSGPNPYAPYIIFGPPGTGKTTTIVEAILQLRLLNPKSRILVTAGSNSACDTIALRIWEYFKSSPRLQEHLSSTDALPIIRIFSKSIQKRGMDTISKQLIKCSNVTWNSGTHAYPAVEDIRKYGIVVATLCTVGKLVTGDVNVPNYFTHIFIDEAAASTEPETLVGIMGIKKSNNDDCLVILSGDHKQLGPVLKSDIAIKLGLDLSIMQRLLNSECYTVDKNGNYDRTLQTRLRRNYRSRAEIVELYNHLYYNNELKAMNSQNDTKFQKNWSFLPNSSYPIVFQAVHGVTIKEDSTSSCNKLEIEVLIWYIKRLIEVDRVKENDIGVIAPYKLQCQHIRNRLNGRNWKNVEVGSVENYQGREKEIIIVSMVRSFSALGFLKSPRRLNVLLSRAKSLLIMVGNPVSLRHCKDINFIIEKCKEKGTYLRKEKTK